MAQTVNTVYIDDLDNSEISGEQATTIAWSWRGVDYEFDTAADRVDALEEGGDAVTVTHLLAVSRRVDGGRTTPRPGPRRARGGSEAAVIRAWARDNGIGVPSRGRIPTPVRDSYAAAQAQAR